MKNINRYIFPTAILIGGVALFAIGGKPYDRAMYNPNDTTLMICGAILIIIGIIFGVFLFFCDEDNKIYDIDDEDKKWLIKAAEAGDADALYALGELYSLPRRAQDYVKAIYWYKKADAQGSRNAYQKIRDAEYKLEEYLK